MHLADVGLDGLELGPHGDRPGVPCFLAPREVLSVRAVAHDVKRLGEKEAAEFDEGARRGRGGRHDRGGRWGSARVKYTSVFGNVFFNVAR